MYGKSDSFGPIRLENSKNNFERGQVDEFQVECSVGDPLKSIKIMHDNTGLGPAWFLKAVVIRTDGGDALQFPANRWLSADTSCEAVLFPSRAGQPLERPHRYKVIVYTTDIRGAGTDANVSLRIHGTGGLDSGPLRLESSKNDFERGTESTFFFDLPDLGEVSSIDIGHDGSGLGSAWHLDSVVVRDETTRKEWRFPHDNWIPDAKDKRLVVTLMPMLGAEGVTREFGNFRVTTFTSDIKGAGTDANVYIILKGQDGRQTPKLKLDSSANDFERGRTDRFALKKVKRVGDIKSIIVGHDNSGKGSASQLHCV